jgi:hypothetical protein
VKLESEDGAAVSDEWEAFRNDEGEPIRVEELQRLNFKDMPEDILISIMDDYFPDARIWRVGDCLICEIEEHLYTKYWEHKFGVG